MSESAKLGNVTKIKQFEEPTFPGLSKISWVRSVTASHGTGAKPNLKELVLQISPKWRSFPDGSFLSEQIQGYSMNDVQMPQKPVLCANSIDQTHILFLLDFHDRPWREALFDLRGTLLTYKTRGRSYPRRDHWACQRIRKSEVIVSIVISDLSQTPTFHPGNFHTIMATPESHYS